jgi:hypothetical protein
MTDVVHALDSWGRQQLRPFESVTDLGVGWKNVARFETKVPHFDHCLHAYLSECGAYRCVLSPGMLTAEALKTEGPEVLAGAHG